ATALASEPAPTLLPAQRAAVVSRATTLVRPTRPLWVRLATSISACAAVMALFILAVSTLGAGGGGRGIQGASPPTKDDISDVEIAQAANIANPLVERRSTYEFDGTPASPSSGGDLSGFPLPRVGAGGGPGGGIHL